MRANELTESQTAAAMARYEQADDILTDYETQHGFKLPQPWRVTIPRLLLQGLGEPELHLIFDTIGEVEFAAGRLAEKPADYSAFDE